MTEPQDPFAAPTGQPPVPPPPPGYPPPPPPGYAPPPPAYGAPPPAYGAPPPGYGQQPVYGMPTGPAPTYAPWGTRAAAALVDFAIILVAELVVRVVSAGLATLVGLAIGVYFAYLVGTTGQSPGKQVLKIKIVRDADGQLLGFGTALLRQIAHLLDAWSLLIGYLWPLWDKKNQTFADKIVGSVSVRA